jgi:hypothetical protein
MNVVEMRFEAEKGPARPIADCTGKRTHYGIPKVNVDMSIVKA